MKQKIMKYDNLAKIWQNKSLQFALQKMALRGAILPMDFAHNILLLIRPHQKLLHFRIFCVAVKHRLQSAIFT